MISKTQSIRFQDHEGHFLSAKIEFPPDRRPYAFAILSHCFACYKDWSAARNISRSLAAQGIAVLRFDFTGKGENESSRVPTRFGTNVINILAAAAFLEKHFNAASMLIGHSLGGTAALYAARSLPQVKGVVTIGSPADPGHMQPMIREHGEDISESSETEIFIDSRPFVVSEETLLDLDQVAFGVALKKLRKAILIMHAPFDAAVNIDHAKWLFQHALHPKSFISLDGADHLLGNQQDSIYVGQMIAAWASRYLPQKSQTLMSEMEVVASLQPDNHYTSLIRAGKHYFIADEPESVGGDDFGPSPYQLLTASLGACSAMTLKMYADRKKWNLGEIQIHLKHDKVYVDDQNEVLEGQDAARQKIDVIERLLDFTGDLSVEQKERLLEIANRCPVHRTLEAAVLIKTRLKEDQTPMS